MGAQSKIGRNTQVNSESSKTVSASSIFQKCPKGHRTVDKEDFIYDSIGRRSCRQCVIDERKGRSFTKRKAF
jgi:hypothetical protein